MKIILKNVFLIKYNKQYLKKILYQSNNIFLLKLNICKLKIIGEPKLKMPLLGNLYNLDLI